MSIKDNIDDLKKDLENYDANLLAVTKTHGIDKIMEVYNYGLRDFGENKVQELIEKKEKMPEDINWHLIGHLQTNKVNKIVGEVSLIHSVDSLKILKKINNRAKSLSIVQDCLIQVNISKEETKSGFFVDEIDKVVEEASKLDNINIKGLMTMAPNTEDENLIRNCFRELKKIFEKLSNLSYNNIEMKYRRGRVPAAHPDGLCGVQLRRRVLDLQLPLLCPRRRHSHLGPAYRRQVSGRNRVTLDRKEGEASFGTFSPLVFKAFPWRSRSRRGMRKDSGATSANPYLL